MLMILPHNNPILTSSGTGIKWPVQIFRSLETNDNVHTYDQYSWKPVMIILKRYSNTQWIRVTKIHVKITFKNISIIDIYFNAIKYINSNLSIDL